MVLSEAAISDTNQKKQCEALLKGATKAKWQGPARAGGFNLSKYVGVFREQPDLWRVRVTGLNEGHPTQDDAEKALELYAAGPPWNVTMFKYLWRPGYTPQ